MVDSNLSFGLLRTKESVQTADYKSAGSNQNETLKFNQHSATSGDFEDIHTVTTGKTFYVSSIIITNAAGTLAGSNLATGAAASEVLFARFNLAAQETKTPNFNTPIKFSSGTRISWTHSQGAGGYITLIGWEE